MFLIWSILLKQPFRIMENKQLLAHPDKQTCTWPWRSTYHSLKRQCSSVISLYVACGTVKWEKMRRLRLHHHIGFATTASSCAAGVFPWIICAKIRAYSWARCCKGYRWNNSSGCWYKKDSWEFWRTSGSHELGGRGHSLRLFLSLHHPFFPSYCELHISYTWIRSADV